MPRDLARLPGVAWQLVATLCDPLQPVDAAGPGADDGGHDPLDQDRRLVTEHRLDEDEALVTAVHLVTTLPERAFTR